MQMSRIVSGSNHKCLWMYVMICSVVLFSLVGCQGEQGQGPLQIGDTAPDFMTKDLSDNVIVLSNLKGRGPLMLRFFETGCMFCRADTPVIREFYETHKENGLNILYIGSFYEDREGLLRFAEELNIPFSLILDQNAKLADLYDIRAYPQTLFISPDLKVLAGVLGGIGTAELEEIFGPYLEEKK